MKLSERLKCCKDHKVTTEEVLDKGRLNYINIIRRQCEDSIELFLTMNENNMNRNIEFLADNLSIMLRGINSLEDSIKGIKSPFLFLRRNYIMKILPYEAFCELRAGKLKFLRKKLKLTRNEVGAIFGSDDYMADSIERVFTQSNYRSDYLNYIYEIIIDEMNNSGRPAKDILKEMVDLLY